jgi:hypothetical protein
MTTSNSIRVNPRRDPPHRNVDVDVNTDGTAKLGALPGIPGSRAATGAGTDPGRGEKIAGDMDTR